MFLPNCKNGHSFNNFPTFIHITGCEGYQIFSVSIVVARGCSFCAAGSVDRQSGQHGIFHIFSLQQLKDLIPMWRSFSLNQDMFPNLKGFAKEMLVMFASTFCVREDFLNNEAKQVRPAFMGDGRTFVRSTLKMQPDFCFVSDFKQLFTLNLVSPQDYSSCSLSGFQSFCCDTSDVARFKNAQPHS